MSEYCKQIFAKHPNVGNIALDNYKKSPETAMVREESFPFFTPWREHRGYVLSVLPKTDVNKSRCILYVHGGGFNTDSPNTYKSVLYKLATKTKCAVFAPDYTLAPMGKFPTQMNQILEVAALLKKKFKELVLIGDSAGGTIALSCALRFPNLFVRLGLVSPWIYLTSDTPSYKSRAWCASEGTGDPIFKSPASKNTKESRESALLYLGDRRYDLFKNGIANPGVATDARIRALPPMHIWVGDDESIREDSLLFGARAQKLGVKCGVSLYTGMWHDWWMYSQGCGSGKPIEKSLDVYESIKALVAGRKVVSKLLHVEASIVLSEN
jgi:acetyl esterase/lipase